MKHLIICIRILIFGAIILLPLVFSFHTFDGYETVKLTVFIIISGILVALHVLIIAFYKISFSKSSKLLIFTIITIFLSIIIRDFFISQNLLASIHRLMYFALCLNIVLITGIITTLDKKTFFKIGTLYICSGTITALIGILQYFGIDYSQVYLPGSRIYSTMSNPNFLAPILMLSFFWGIFLLLKSKNIYLRIFVIITIVINLFAIYLTHTRSVIITLIIFSLFYIKKYFKIKHAAVAVLIIIIIGTTFIKNNRSISFHDGTVKYRLNLMKIGLNIFRENPILGIGTDNFFMYHPFFQSNIITFSSSPNEHNVLEQYCHNEPLQSLIENGFIIFGLIIFFIVCILKHNNTSYFISFIILTMIFHSLFSFPFHLANTMLAICIFIGMSLEIHLKRNIYSGITKYSLYCIAIVAVLFTLFSANSIYRSDRNIKYAEAYVNINPQKSLELYKSALKYRADYGDYHHRLGVHLLKLHKIKDAKREFNIAFRINPSETALANLGTAQYYLNSNFESILSYKKSLSLYPFNTTILSNLLIIYNKIGQYRYIDNTLRYFNKYNILKNDNNFQRLKMKYLSIVKNNIKM